MPKSLALLFVLLSETMQIQIRSQQENLQMNNNVIVNISKDFLYLSREMIVTFEIYGHSFYY